MIDQILSVAFHLQLAWFGAFGQKLPELNTEINERAEWWRARGDRTDPEHAGGLASIGFVCAIRSNGFGVAASIRAQHKRHPPDLIRTS